MSFDPFSSDRPQPFPDLNQPTPSVAPAYPNTAESQAREKLLTPAILLIVLAVLNLLCALLIGLATLNVFLTPAEVAHRQSLEAMEKMAERFPVFAEAAAKQREEDPEAQKQQSLLTTGLSGLVLLLIALLGLWSGINMLRLRGYGMALVGVVATALPCLSLSGCCCGFGQIVSVWSLVLLLRDEVRNCFR